MENIAALSQLFAGLNLDLPNDKLKAENKVQKIFKLKGFNEYQS